MRQRYAECLGFTRYARNDSYVTVCAHDPDDHSTLHPNRCVISTQWPQCSVGQLSVAIFSLNVTQPRRDSCSLRPRMISRFESRMKR